jgi:hypothetical protein
MGSLIENNISERLLIVKCNFEPPLVFSLPMTGVDPVRGFIRPRLRANRMKLRKDLETPVSP